MWHVVRPLPGDIRDKVLIQNEARHINVEVPLSAESIQDLPDERKITIIRNAIMKATARRLPLPKLPRRSQRAPPAHTRGHKVRRLKV